MPKKKASATIPAVESVAIVITADHVYLPVDADGNVGTPWAASNVSTSKVFRRTHLRVPPDLARFLSERDQAEVMSGPVAAGPPAEASAAAGPPAEASAKAGA